MAEDAPLVVVLMGVSGCGKSTAGNGLAKLTGWTFRDADSFHPPANVAKMTSGLSLTDEDRWPWLAAIGGWIDTRLAERAPAIVSCSALKRAYRARIVGSREGVRLVFLKGEPALIGARLGGRKGHFMPASLLASQFAVLEEPAPEERALVVPVGLSPRRVVATIVERLGLPQAAARG